MLSLADNSKVQPGPFCTKGSLETKREGWFLQKPRAGGIRFMEQVRLFLKDGFQTSFKMEPVQVTADMRKVRNCQRTQE